jgi:hypothetical protein
MEQNWKIRVCAWTIAVALSFPCAASADEAKDNGEGAAKLPAVAVETAEYQCHEKPPICNCMDAEKCKALASSGRCKEGTYHFWEDSKLGSCVWNGSK